MLTDRQKLILKFIIEDYVETNEPIGSKSLTNKPYLKFSPATIRYDMQMLEEEGFLEKTHISSGRAPSDMGYRYYVDHLLTRDYSNKDVFYNLDLIINNNVLNQEEKLLAIIKYLSLETGYFLTVLGSSESFSKVKKLEIIPLSDEEALLLIVTNNGCVKSIRKKVPRYFKMEYLIKVMNMFDVAVYDESISNITNILKKEASKPKIREIVDFKDEVIDFMIKAFEKFSYTENFQSGLYQLFYHPEFKNNDLIKKVIKLVDDNLLKEIVSSNNKGLNISLGSENSSIGMQDFAILSIPYFKNNLEYGNIVLLGPKRLNYKKIIPVLEYLSYNLSKIFK